MVVVVLVVLVVLVVGDIDRICLVSRGYRMELRVVGI